VKLNAPLVTGPRGLLLHKTLRVSILASVTLTSIDNQYTWRVARQSGQLVLLVNSFKVVTKW